MLAKRNKMQILRTEVVRYKPGVRWIAPSVEVDAMHRGLRQEFVVNFNRKGRITGAVKTAPRSADGEEEYYVFDKIPTDIVVAAAAAFKNDDKQ
jgi:hypothetical protein